MRKEKLKILSDIMEALYTHQRIIESYNSTSRRYGTEDELFMTEVHVIQAIGNNSGLSLTELANITFRTGPAMSMLIKNLSEKGLVKRERDQEDNRKYILTLTEKGKIVYYYHEKLDETNYSEILDSLSEKIDLSLEDLKNTKELLEHINLISDKRVN